MKTLILLLVPAMLQAQSWSVVVSDIVGDSLVRSVMDTATVEPAWCADGVVEKDTRRITLTVVIDAKIVETDNKQVTFRCPRGAFWLHGHIDRRDAASGPDYDEFRRARVQPPAAIVVHGRAASVKYIAYAVR